MDAPVDFQIGRWRPISKGQRARAHHRNALHTELEHKDMWPTLPSGSLPLGSPVVLQIA